MYEIFEGLLAKYNVTAYRVSKETGIGQSTFTDWKKGKSSPKQEKLQKIADYFNVSVDYLTGREKEWEPTLTDKDEKDIKKKLDSIINQLDSDTGLMYDGLPVDNETQELFKDALEVAMKTAAITAKKKYTPKKYRK